MDKIKEIQLKEIFINDSEDAYLPSGELVKALQIAYALQRPLLISGEPGTGKSDFAKWVAKILFDTGKGFHKKPLVYNTKSTSVAQDLFYFYDAVGHFRGDKSHVEKNVVANQKTSTEQHEDKGKTLTQKESVITTQVDTGNVSPQDFIELKALGLAFARAKGKSNAEDKLKPFFELQNIDDSPVGSVVLIDEIDKAPRDFPNDLLNEIEKYEFEVREIGRWVKLEKKEERKKVIIILTSNFEKNLPEAFLRRCIYFHIEFPKRGPLIEIVKERLGINKNDLEQVGKRVDEFIEIRKLDLQKKPSTSELLDYMRTIKDENLLEKSLMTADGKWDKESELIRFIPVLIKKYEDLQLFMSK